MASGEATCGEKGSQERVATRSVSTRRTGSAEAADASSSSRANSERQSGSRSRNQGAGQRGLATPACCTAACAYRAERARKCWCGGGKVPQPQGATFPKVGRAARSRSNAQKHASNTGAPVATGRERAARVDVHRAPHLLQIISYILLHVRQDRPATSRRGTARAPSAHMQQQSARCRRARNRRAAGPDRRWTSASDGSCQPTYLVAQLRF